MRKLMLWMLFLLLCLPLAAAAESPAYQNESYGLSFTLPEGWSEISDERLVVFAGPEGGDTLLLIGLTGQTVDAGFAASFDASVAETLMREDPVFEDIVFAEVTSILFVSATDAGGRLYAFNACVFAGEGFPDGFALFYMQYFFTCESGELGSVSLIAPAIEDSNSILGWFDAMVGENVPQGVLEELNEQAGI